MTDATNDEGAPDLDGLTVRQRAFADAYLELLGTGDTRPKYNAAVKAGYAESCASAHAYRCLRNPAIMAYIGHHLSASAAKVGIDKSYVLFKAVIAVEMAEAQGNVGAMRGALDLVAKHVDVQAFLPDATGGVGGGAFAGDLTQLTRDELLQLAHLLARMGGRSAEPPVA